MVVYEKFFFKVQSEFSVQGTTKQIFVTDNHHKTIFGSVRMACSSYTVFVLLIALEPKVVGFFNNHPFQNYK